MAIMIANFGKNKDIVISTVNILIQEKYVQNLVESAQLVQTKIFLVLHNLQEKKLKNFKIRDINFLCKVFCAYLNF